MNEPLKLKEALQILQRQAGDALEYSVWLATGSTAEPLSQFLAAYLQRRLPDHRVQIRTGLFGDLLGNVQAAMEAAVPVIVLLEWADLDARLGMRQPGGWGRSIADDVPASVEQKLDRLGSLIKAGEGGGTVVIAGPTLPPAPLVPAPPWQMQGFYAVLDEMMARFRVRATSLPGVRLLNPVCLDEIPASHRMDLKTWWQAGVPYQRAFVSVLAEQLADALIPPARLKGIITDLDDTVWAGILGDVGPDGVSWDLDHHAVQHGIYQQFLQSLAEDGILVAVASKNDSQLVEQAFQRSDLLLKPESLFPVEAHWSPKPESAARILQAWNIGEDSVVFLDDSPLEVATMRMAFPKMDCREFPVGDPAAFMALLVDLLTCFGQAQRSEEDTLRLASLRAGSLRSATSNGYSPEDLLKSCNGVLTVSRLSVPPDPRALELLNKTNQFNLNGKRQTEADWLSYLKVEGAAAWIASYGDKFGSLGKIAVLAGRRAGNRLEVDSWVMSCRAFSRRIEYALLDYLFSSEPIEEMILDFRATERNGPLREFLQCLAAEPAEGSIHLAPGTFASRRPALYMSVTGDQ